MEKLIYIFIGLFTFYSQITMAQCFTERHTTNAFDGWISCNKSVHEDHQARGERHWIEYDFGSTYSIHDLVFWNMNHPEYLDDGIKNVIVEYSDNGSNWTLFDTVTIPRAPASGFYEGNFGPDLGGVNARYLLLTAIDNYGGACCGLSEIKVYTSDAKPTEFEFAITTCEADGILQNITGGMELNGTYSGTAVTDNGDETFDFDANVAGPGSHLIRYTYSGGQLSSTIKVLPCTSPLCANCPDCGDFDESMVNNNPIPSDDYHMAALHGSGTVAPAQPVSFRGKDEVVMEAGFEVQMNTDFVAEIRACDENILSNGGFEYEGQDWTFFVSPWNPVTATIDFNIAEPYSEEHSAKIEITQSDGSAWQVRLEKLGLTMENGSIYEFSFYGKKDNGGDMILSIQEADDPWHTYEWERIDMDNMWRKYTYIFDGEKTSNIVAFRLNFGETTGTWYIDKLKLVKLEE